MTVGILNVGAGDTKLTFDKSNPTERVRAARIVKDMIRRGYALLIEVDDGNGGKTHTRAHDFDENTCEYIIADFDPMAAADADHQEHEHALSPNPEPRAAAPVEAPAATPRRGRPPKRVAAESTRAIAVSRTAGG